MKFISGILLFFFLFSSTLLAQLTSDLDKLQNHYESFEYSLVITKALNLILDKERFSDKTLIKIYTLKAASHYAMGENNNTRKTFYEVLKLNKDYELSSLTYSPKLVELFKDVKKEFSEILKTNKETLIQKNKVEPDKIFEYLTVRDNEFNSALAKSLILPGWGHLHLVDNTHALILTSASSVTLVSMIYFIFDTNSKEREYLSSTKPQLIQTRYDEYNKSYKIRNALIAAYAAIWLYSQIDLLFFSEDLGSKNITLQNPGIRHPINQENITMSFTFPF